MLIPSGKVVDTIHYRRAVMGVHLALSQHWICPCPTSNPDFTA
jgi:hypothetical protein